MKEKKRAPRGTRVRQISPRALPNSIRALRRKKGYATQKSLADALDVAPALVSYWENGFFLPSSPNIKKLCDLLECDVDTLFDWRS